MDRWKETTYVPHKLLIMMAVILEYIFWLILKIDSTPTPLFLIWKRNIWSIFMPAILQYTQRYISFLAMSVYNILIDSQISNWINISLGSINRLKKGKQRLFNNGILLLLISYISCRWGRHRRNLGIQSCQAISKKVIGKY